MSLPRQERLPSGHVITVEFSEDEMERRVAEVVRRCARMPATFDLDTGQPFHGEPLSAEELIRRGYATVEKK